MRNGTSIAAALVSLLTLQVEAQNIVSNTTLYIPENLSVSAPASIINNNFIQNNGTLSLNGDWLNLAVYQGNGTLVLAGSDQIVNNNDQPVSMISIQGGGIKTLQGNLLVTREINFTNGRMKVNAADSLITGTEAVVSGGSRLSYADGPMVSVGSGQRFYPVGKNGGYHPVELTDVKGINPRIQIEVEELLPPVTTDLRSALQHDVYWIRKTLDGTFSGSPISLGYDMSAFDRLRIVIAEGTDLTSEFKVLVNNSFPTANVTETRQDVTGNFFAIGILLGELPNAFYFSTTLSPGATAIENRTARVFGGDISSDNFYFQVFNRWGQVIFETKSYEDMTAVGWDGKQDGNFLPSGTYPYSLKYSTLAGAPAHQTGFITILR